MIALMYHDVYVKNPKESGFASDLYKISIDEFEDQVVKIKDLITNKGVDICLTFDDGGASFYTPISSILDKYGLKGVFFIATKYIGKEGFVTEEQIRDIDSRGHYIGSHSYSHPENMTDLTLDEIEKEWSMSVSTLEKIVNHPITVASIPNGYQSEQIYQAVAKTHITKLYTSKPTCAESIVENNLALIGRYVVLNGMNTDDVVSLITSKKRRRMLLLRWGGLNMVKWILGGKYEAIKNKLLGNE